MDLFRAEAANNFLRGWKAPDILNAEEINKIYQREVLKLFSSSPHASYIGSFNSVLQEAAYHVARTLYSDDGILIVAPPGSGKTRTALMVYLALLDCFKGTLNPQLNQSSVALITYNPKVFGAELEKNPIYKKYMVGLDTTLDQTNFVAYGYKTLALSVFTNYGNQAEKDILANEAVWNDRLEKLVAAGKITINEAFVNSFVNCSAMIADEIHETYTGNQLNYMGLAISLLRQRNPHLKFIAMSATPLSSNFLELIPIASLILNQQIDIKISAKTTAPEDIKGFERLIMGLSARTFFINPPQSKFFPTISIEGGTINDERSVPEEEFVGINFVKCPLTNRQLDHYFVDRGIQYLKINEHAAMPPHVGKSSAIVNISREHLQLWYRDLPTILQSSSKINMMHELLIGRKVMAQRGGVVIYTDLNIFPYAMLVIHYLELLGFKEYNKGGRPQICSKCCGPHVKGADHDFAPAYYAVLNSTMNATDIQSILDAYNSPENYDGKLIKVLVGSRLIMVSINLNNTASMFVYRMPPSTSNLIQLMGRVFRSMIITDPLMDPHVKIYLLLATRNDGVETLEIEREKKKAAAWRLIQTIVRKIAANSINNHMIVPTSQLALFVDKPTQVIKDKMHVTSNRMGQYLLYPPEFEATTTLDRRPGKGEAIELTRELRITLSILLIKSILMINSHVRLQQIYNMAEKGIDFYFFNTKSLTHADINIAIITLHTIGQQTIGMRVLTTLERQVADMKDAYVNNVVMSVTSPWLITPEGQVKQVVVSGDSIVSTDYTLDIVQPRALNFITHVNMDKCRTVKIPPYKVTTNTLIDFMLDKIRQYEKDGQPPLSMFCDNIEVSQLERLLETIIKDAYKSYKKDPAYKKLCQLFNLIGLLPDKERATLATGIKFKAEWPVAYIWGNYYYWDGEERVIISNMEPHLPSYNNDVCLQIRVQGNYCKIYFFHNEKRINVDRRHDFRGRTIDYVSGPNLKEYLKNSKGVMHDRVQNILDTTQKKSNYRAILQSKIIKTFYEYGLSHLNEDVVRFYWGRPGVKISNWRTDNSVKEADNLINIEEHLDDFGGDEEVQGDGEDCADRGYIDGEPPKDDCGCGGPCCKERMSKVVGGLIFGNNAITWPEPILIDPI